MGARYAFVPMFVLALVLVTSGLADPEVGGDLKTGEKGKVLDAANAASSGDGKKAVIPGGGGSKEGTKSNGDLISNGGANKVDDGQKHMNDPGAKSNSGWISNGRVNGVDDSQKKTSDPGVKEKLKTEVGGKQLGSKGTGIEKPKTDDKGADNKNNLEVKGSKGTGNEGSSGTGPEVKKKNDKVSDEKIINEKGTGNSGVSKEKPVGVPNLDSKDGTLVQERKKGREACDSSSNSCTIGEKSMVACLRVPGNESPNLSLLVQNKGKGPVAVTISAPDFVKLEPKQILVKENNNEKVKVQIGNGEADGQIILKAGNGECALEFKGTVTQSSRKIPGYTQFSYINLLRNPSYLWFVPLAVVLIIASVWTGISFRRKYVARNDPKYQKLEMELPVSGVTKALSDSHEEQDEWDDNWDDNWEDEEVGMPAAIPVTPSFSPSGIASRRAIKDAWKD